MGDTPPEKNIGPYYKLLGAAVVLLTFSGWLLLRQWQGSEWAMWDAIPAGACLLLLILILRPKALDDLVKRVATRLPWTRYDNPPEGEG